jgi:hypothetical protein
MKGMTQLDIARMDAKRSIRLGASEHQMESIRASDGEHQSIRASDREHQGIRLRASD